MNLSTRRQHLLTLAAGLSLGPLTRHALAWEPAASEDRKLGIALLGLGDYATNQLARAIVASRNARLAGIVTGSPEKIPVWQEKYEIPDGNVFNYENFEDIADNKDIDVVYVVTPTSLHPEFTIRGLKAGKHVICEKPMAPTVEDCTRMIDAAKEAGKTLQIGYRLHWDPYHLRLIEAVSKQEFGAWKGIEVANGGRMMNFTGLNQWRVEKERGVAGALYDLGVYAVQAALYSAGEHPLRVTAEHSTVRKEEFSEVPETYHWELEFAGERKAKGKSSYGENYNFVKVETEGGEIALEPAYGYGGQKGHTPDGPMDFKHVHQQKLQIEGQIDAILSKTPSIVPGEMGRRDIRVIRGIMEAADSGKPFEFGKFLY